MKHQPSQIIDELLVKLDKQEKLTAMEAIEETRIYFTALELDEMLFLLKGHPFLKFDQSESTYERLKTIDAVNYFVILGGIAAPRIAKLMEFDDRRISIIKKVYDCDPASADGREYFSKRRNFRLTGAFWMLLGPILITLIWSYGGGEAPASEFSKWFGYVNATLIGIGAASSLILFVSAFRDGRRNFKKIPLRRRIAQ